MSRKSQKIVVSVLAVILVLAMVLTLVLPVIGYGTGIVVKPAAWQTETGVVASICTQY